MTKGIKPEFNTLIDRAALDFLKSKKLLPGFSHYDVWLYEHAVAFTVAKMMDEDMLAEVKAAVEAAIANGTGWHTFQKQLKPYLMARGWWGESVMLDPVDGIAKTVQLGSTRRLRTIFHTNFQTAHAAGQWARVQAAKEELPYLKYLPSVAGERREAHKRYYNLILPVEHPLWRQIFPPNGYGCLCGVIQLTEKQALRERAEDIEADPDAFTPEQIENSKKGRLNDTPDIKTVEVTNPRTGQVVRIPADITPSFAHSHGDRLGALDELFAAKHGAKVLKKLVAERAEYLNGKLAVPTDAEVLASSESIIAEGKRLFEKHRALFEEARAAGDPRRAVIEMLRREGVELGGLADAVVGTKDKKLVKQFQDSVGAYPAAWIEKSNQMGRVILQNAPSRAFCATIGNSEFLNRLLTRGHLSKVYKPFKWAFSGDGRIKIGDSMILNNTKHSVLTVSTQVHEYAHRLQAAMPELDAYFTRLWEDRTKGEDVQTMREMTGNSAYHVKEVGKRDGFPHPYYGKMYGDESNPRPLEMMSMTFESILGGRIERYEQIAKHPDFLYFGLALLVRYKP